LAERRARQASVAVIAALAVIGFSQAAPAGQQSDIATTIRMEHQEFLSRLDALSQRPAPVGPEARKLADLVKPQLVRHEDVLLPTLTLLPEMAGEDYKEWKWTLPLIDRVRAQQPLNYRQEQKINVQIAALASAAQTAGDGDALSLVQRLSGVLEEEDDVIQATVLLVGQHLRPKPRIGY
jgi:hypothetical protein